MTARAAVALLCLWGGSGGSALQAQNALDRAITLPASVVSLRAALDTVAARADIRLSYSAEKLPLEREVSLTRGRTTIGAALRALLKGVPVSPVAVADDHIVIVPAAPLAGESGATLLERVDVKGHSLASRGSRPTEGVEILSGESLERRNVTTLSQALSGSVPGLWMWDQSPSALAAHYGSIRGTSSFGVSYPKVYVDGIEIANPMFATRIIPELIDRIEVIRGPQGAALYGADAISGVVNIISRHEGSRRAATSLVQSDFGVTQSAYGMLAPTQRHLLSLRKGDDFRSGGLSALGAGSGDYVPNGYARDIQLLGDFRTVGPASSLSLTARVQGKEAGVPTNPLVQNPRPSVFGPDRGQQALAMYSVGSVMQRTPADHRTHTFVAGVDGYRLSNVHLDDALIPTAADSALQSASGGADRLTFRATTERRHTLSEQFAGRITLGAEQTLLRDHSISDGDDPGDSATVATRRIAWTTNSGVLARGDLAWHRALFFTVGSRVERIQTERHPTVVALLPNVGVAARHDFSVFVATARAAYGKGIRSPSAGAGVGLFMRSDADYAPETQSGVEMGLDLQFGRLASLQITRFDQVASALRQPTGLPGDIPICADGCDATQAAAWTFHQSSVVGGAIRNRGWEARGSILLRNLMLTGATAITDSRVLRIADGYAGELRVGDRMFGVPGRTGSLTAEWVHSLWSTAWTVSRAANWVNYDRLRLAAVLDSAGVSATLGDLDLRDYWATYPGTARLRGTFMVQLPNNTALQVTGENLTNVQTGEPDSITILPGRSIMLGLRARF